jgi:hypothetical protein
MVDGWERVRNVIVGPWFIRTARPDGPGPLDSRGGCPHMSCDDAGGQQIPFGSAQGRLSGLNPARSK